MVLILSVEPGFGGQQFMPEVLSKVVQVQVEHIGLNPSVESS